MNDAISSNSREKLRAQAKAEIDAMSKDELLYAIEKGGEWQLLGMIPNMRVRLAQLVDDERGEERREDVSLAKDANTISAKAYRLSKWAIVLSTLAIVVSMCAPD